MNINKNFCLLGIIIFVFLLENIMAQTVPGKFKNKFKIDTDTGVLCFLKDDGRALKSYKIQKYIPGKQSPSRVSISDNGNFICVTTVTKENEEGEGDANSIILDDKGNEVWKVNTTYSSALVAPNGNYIICGHADGPPKIYYKNGNILEIKDDSLSNEKYSYEGDNQYSFSQNGSLVIALIGIGDMEILRNDTAHWDNGYINELVAVSETGQILWKKNDLPQGLRWIPSVEVLKNNDVQIVLFNCQDKTKRFRLYDAIGNLIKSDTPEAK